jgi:hypothetical protein
MWSMWVWEHANRWYTGLRSIAKASKKASHAIERVDDCDSVAFQPVHGVSHGGIL